MPWVSLGVMAVGAFMGNKAKKAAKKQQKAANAKSEEEIALQREGLDFSKKQHSEWKERYDPVYDEMMAEIDSGITPDYAAIAGDVNSSFDTARGMERRQMARYGVRPQDGAYSQSERDYGIARSTAHSGIRNQARQASAGIKFNRLNGIASTLTGVGVQLGDSVGNSYSRTGNAIGAYADNLNSQADTNYQRSNENIEGIGTAIGGVDWGGLINRVKSGGWGIKNATSRGQMGPPAPRGQMGPPAPAGYRR